jgi:hypothetical protein
MLIDQATDEDDKQELSASQVDAISSCSLEKPKKGPPSGMGKATSVHAFIIIREETASPKPPSETTNALGGGNGLYAWKIGNELCSRCLISKEGACWDHGGNKEMGGVY